MLSRFLSTLADIVHTPQLRRKLLFTAGILAIFRLLAHVPVPAVDIAALQGFFAANQFLSLLNIFSGGTWANFSVMAVGISPYITASIVLQLAAMVIPSLKEMQREGESGKERYNQYTRMLSVPLAVVQSISVLVLLNTQGLLQSSQPLVIISMIMTLVAGAMILMWLGELASLYGIGNGISIVLLAGIISQFPVAILQAVSLASSQRLFTNAVFIITFLLIIALIVFMNEAIRRVPIQYAKRVRGSRTYGGHTTHLPIRVNVAGVLPIIFAVSIMLAPTFVGRLMVGLDNPTLQDIGSQLTIWFNPISPVYMSVFFLVVFAFTFFSALIFFNTDDIADELKKSGAFVPGIRPGGPTKKFLEFVVTRITLVGAIFLGAIAIVPSIVQAFTGVQSLAIGGTSVLIVVSVILETSKQVESMLVGQNYEQYA